MFCTRIILNSRHPALKEDRQNACLRHRRIESLFPEHKRSEASALFRWDDLSIFVQSAIEPRFDLLPKNYTSDTQTKEINFAQALKPQQWLEFCLLADTTGIERDTRRRVSRDPTQLPEWLSSRLEGVAQLDEFLAIHRSPDLAIQRMEKQWKIKPTLFSGYLQVTNPEQLELAISSGFGRSRAYGCGLMQIALARS
jgi:CRISPR system Cascade subunit CasE